MLRLFHGDTAFTGCSWQTGRGGNREARLSRVGRSPPLRLEAAYRADKYAIFWTAVGIVAHRRQDHLERGRLHTAGIDESGKRIQRQGR